MPTPHCNEQFGPGDCVADHATRFISAKRSQAGTWFITFGIRCMTHLPDGRKVELPEKEVTIRAYRQIGRKPVDGKLRQSPKLSRAIK